MKNGGDFMEQEYIFNNKKYESAIINIKAILMDIISSEMYSISNKEQEISVERDKETTIKLKKICEQEKLSVKKLLEVGNNFASLLEKIDSFSNDFTAVLAENIAQIMENYRNNESKSIESNLENNVQKKEESSVENIEKSTNVSSNMVKQNNDNVQDEIISKQDGTTYPINKEQEISLPKQEVPNKIEDSTKDVAGNSNTISSFSESIEPEKEISESNIILPPLESKKNITNNIEDSSNKHNVEDINTNQKKPTNDLIPTPGEIPVVKDSMDNAKGQGINENLSLKNNNPDVESTIVQPVEERTNIGTSATTDENNDKTLVFNIINNNKPRAILTSAKQIFNLRQSLPTQEALVQARDSIASTNVAGVNDEIQKLVSNGVIAPSEESIEDMMAEASKLYQEGKTKEAQAMYDRISELNKQMKENSQDETKPIELTKNNQATFAT